MSSTEREECLKAMELIRTANTSEADPAANLPERLQAVSQALEIFSNHMGPDQVDTGAALLAQGRLLRLSKQFDQATVADENALKIFEKTLGEGNPLYATALRELGHVYFDQGRASQALPLTKQALETFRKTLGPMHSETIMCTNGLAAMYEAEADFKDALPLAQKVVEAMNSFSNRPLDIPHALQSLAEVYAGLGKYTEARECAERGLHQDEQKLGTDSPALVPSILCLARVLNRAGEYSAAEPLFKRAADIEQKSLGLNHAETAEALLQLATFYHGIGNDLAAQPAYQQAMKASESEGVKDTLAHAAVLEGVAGFYRDEHDLRSAETSYAQALFIREKLLGSEDLQVAALLNEMARLEVLQKNIDSARKFAERALKIQELVLPEQHQSKADSLLTLGYTQVIQRDFGGAQSSFERALNIYEAVYGADFPATDRAIDLLANLYLLKGDYAHALPLARRTLESVQKWSDSHAMSQSERQQIALEHLLRPRLNSFVTAAVASHLDTAEIYQQVLLWKGIAFLRQRSINAARKSLNNDPTVVALFNDLQMKARALSNAYDALEEKKLLTTENKQLFQLSEELETAQRKLAEKMHDGHIVEDKRTTLADLQKALPEKTGLVDVLEYMRFNKLTGDRNNPLLQRSLIAFVVRPDKKIEMVDLGQSEPIDQLVSRWRKAELPLESDQNPPSVAQNVKGSTEKTLDKKDAGIELRVQIWEKLAPYLEGCETVLISPDGVLASLAWGALPGRRPANCLLEELPIVVIPVPQMLPELLAKPNANDTQQSPKSLLVVGNVDLYADPGKPEVHATPQIPKFEESKLDNYGSLPTTKEQVMAIRERFTRANPQGRVTLLTGNQPTEQTIRDWAPLSSFVHFAAHGYYKPMPAKNETASESTLVLLDDENPPIPDAAQVQPELLSGICLAGNYRYVQPEKDDGRLTALEVKTMNLDSVEMVMLCSCQTALGESIEGEGMFGLQRAFQEAGVRTTVTTLWKIPVVTSDPLMVEFYDNLWIKKMSRIEALRQAQLKIMHEGIKYLPKERTRGHENALLPPFFWGGFVLAGDWR
jgi:CHAT domain-containing protein